MAEVLLSAARIFASHYQIVVCDDPWRPLADDENWTDEKTLQGFAGASCFRMVGTEADLNDHWIELYASDQPPLLDEWQRVTCVPFLCTTGKVHVMSVIDQEAPVTADIPKGNYAVHVAGQNLGIDLRSKGEKLRLTDEALAARKDLEWYRIFLVPGIPTRTGRHKDDLMT
jgi:Competence protein J (ComJ)